MEDDGLGHRVPGTVTVCSPIALNMSSMMRPARSPLDLAQSFVLDPAFHAPWAAVSFEQRRRRVARDSLALERAFERGVGLQQQAPQAVDVAGGFVGEVLVVAGEQLQGGEVSSSGPASLSVSGQRARPTRSHARPCGRSSRPRAAAARSCAWPCGKVGNRDPHVPRRQGRADGVGLVPTSSTQPCLEACPASCGWPSRPVSTACRTGCSRHGRGVRGALCPVRPAPRRCRPGSSSFLPS